MQTDLAKVTSYGVATAAALEARIASVRKLSQMAGCELAVSLEPEQIARVAEMLRTYADLLVKQDCSLTAQIARAQAAEAALTEGMALVILIRSLSLAEIISFWHGQQARKS